MTYKFKYRRFIFWRTANAIGHSYIKDLDRMDIFLVGGHVFSLSKWSNYDLFLGSDWVIATKEKMEKDAGTTIQLAVGTK